MLAQSLAHHATSPHLVDTSWRHSARQNGERFTIDLVIMVSVSAGRKKDLGLVPGGAVLLLPLRVLLQLDVAMKTSMRNVSCGVRTHAQLPVVDLKSTP